MSQAGWNFPLKDIMRDGDARRALIDGGGRATVPCLRIDRGEQVLWLYESLDIIDYLESRHPAAD
jgi:glutathione S-transferase